MKHTYKVSGIHCQSCVDKIKSALEAYPGITKAEVSLNPPRATISMIDHISNSKLNEAIETAGKYSLSQAIDESSAAGSDEEGKSFAQTYFPLFLIASYLIGGVFLRELQLGRFDTHAMMANFMGGFFVVFSFFKLLDLKGFSEGYSTYDIIAQRWPSYGRVYPFIELGLGVFYLFTSNEFLPSILTVLVMGISSVGVMKSILAGRQIQCTCLGTIFKLPLTNITLFEDLLMVLMALAMLI